MKIPDAQTLTQGLALQLYDSRSDNGLYYVPEGPEQ